MEANILEIQTAIARSVAINRRRDSSFFTIDADSTTRIVQLGNTARKFPLFLFFSSVHLFKLFHRVILV